MSRIHDTVFDENLRDLCTVGSSPRDESQDKEAKRVRNIDSCRSVHLEATTNQNA